MAKVFIKNTPEASPVHNNDSIHLITKLENHHYEEPEEKDNRVFINMQRATPSPINSQMNGNYELMEERETTV